MTVLLTPAIVAKEFLLQLVHRTDAMPCGFDPPSVLGIDFGPFTAEQLSLPLGAFAENWPRKAVKAVVKQMKIKGLGFLNEPLSATPLPAGRVWHQSYRGVHIRLVMIESALNEGWFMRISISVAPVFLDQRPAA